MGGRGEMVEEKQAAEKLMPLVEQHHWLLVTLLLCNALANEALPLFLDRLVPSWLAVRYTTYTFVCRRLTLLCAECISCRVDEIM